MFHLIAILLYHFIDVVDELLRGSLTRTAVIVLLPIFSLASQVRRNRIYHQIQTQSSKQTRIQRLSQVFVFDVTPSDVERRLEFGYDLLVERWVRLSVLGQFGERSGSTSVNLPYATIIATSIRVGVFAELGLHVSYSFEDLFVVSEDSGVVYLLDDSFDHILAFGLGHQGLIGLIFAVHQTQVDYRQI